MFHSGEGCIKSEVKNNNLNSMAKTVYSNGYIPKIEYWLSVSNEAIKEGNVIKSEYALGKAEYFISRQKQVYG